MLNKKMRHENLDMLWHCLVLICTALAASAIIGLTGCATSSPITQSATPNYQLTLSGQLDSQPFTGVALGSSAPSHTIALSSSSTIPYVIVKSCHRSEMHQQVISQGWISETKSWNFSLNLAPTIEDTGDCPLRLCAYSSTVGTLPVQCAFIDFKNSKYVMPGENICNGADGASTGKMICHTQTGLMERVRFAEPMQVAPLQPATSSTSQPYLITNQCDGAFIDDAHQLWQYIMPTKECYVIFSTLKAPHRHAKLSVVPYDTPQPTTGGT